MMSEAAISVTVSVNVPMAKVWELWTTPADIIQWNNLSPEWHSTKADNDMRPGGRFLYVMGLKDGSFSFNFEGTYDTVIPYELITYTLDDQRKTKVTFADTGNAVTITEMFEPTTIEPADMQRDFCQAVLNCFKVYAEGK